MVFIPHYRSSNCERHNEIVRSIRRNIDNKLVERVVLVLESKADVEPWMKNERVVLKVPVVSKRQTYNCVLQHVREYMIANPGTIAIVCNSDISFDSTLEKMIHGQFNALDSFCLSRHDEKEDGSIELCNHHVASQDAWVFFGLPRFNLEGNFFFGVLGCDNHMAVNLRKSGYKVTNPCLSINAIHLHLTENSRTWTKSSRLPQPRGNAIVYKSSL